MLKGTPKLLEKLERLNSECFIYDNYESNWWTLFDMKFSDSLNNAAVMRTVEQYAVGYCEGERLLIRPSADSYAVMFEKDGERFWFHIKKWEFEMYDELMYRGEDDV